MMTWALFIFGYFIVFRNLHNVICKVLKWVHILWISRGANRYSRSQVPNGAGQGISRYSRMNLGPEHLRGEAGQKIYQCHDTGGTGQFGALVDIIESY